MPRASLIVPAFNATRTLAATLTSLLDQRFDDFEVIVVDDGSQDETAALARQLDRDGRLRVIRQPNRGLAGARNSGIAAAKGDYIGFCDADDLWEAGKLAAHVRHLDANPDLGLSFSGSRLVDDRGAPTGLAQRPRLTGITPDHVLKRNPIGNGSAAVMRRAALADLAYRPHFETARDWVFDETFRQSEDIECWMRLMLTTDWQIEGVPGLLTRYRVNASGLSAALDRQLTAWERMIAKLRPLNPAFFAAHEGAARAYQLRYLARRAVSARDGARALDLVCASLRESALPLREEPVKTATTLAAALALRAVGPGAVEAARTALTHIRSH